MARATTLMAEAEAFTREACALVDLRDDLKDMGHEGTELYAATVRALEDVRAKRDAINATIKTLDPGTPNNYVRAYLYG